MSMAQTNKKSALGKGIRALLDTIDDEVKSSNEGVPAVSGQSTAGTTRIPVDQIEINPKQPRTDFDQQALNDIDLLSSLGYGNLPMCMAKTPKSLSDNRKLIGCPRGFKITINELKISAGAGFIVAISGKIMTMPGLPKIPAAAKIRIMTDGHAEGLS